MDKTLKNKPESRKILHFGKGSSTRHFGASGNIRSDVLGSYTGTADTFDNEGPAGDIYPVQDADDL